MHTRTLALGRFGYSDPLRAPEHTFLHRVVLLRNTSDESGTGASRTPQHARRRFDPAPNRQACIGVYWRHDIYLAGVPVRALDAIELIWRLRNYGFLDTAERIQRALTIRTLPAELRDIERDAILYALHGQLTSPGLARLRSALLEQQNAA